MLDATHSPRCTRIPALSFRRVMNPKGGRRKGEKAVKYQEWNLRPRDEVGEAALERAGIPPLAARVLCARGFRTPEQAAALLSTDPAQLHDPFLLLDMKQAVTRISTALERAERIAVYGDYDVDGITSTCLLADYLRSRGGDVTTYIPDRLEEGYGVGRFALEVLHAQGVELIITVDCGITAVAEACYARELGMDFIVTDHHECKAELPQAVAVVNPRRPDCPYPFKALAGVGVTLKLVLALGGADAQAALLRRYADFAAIGTVADVMTLVGENRAIVRLGLDVLRETRRPGLRALLREAGLEDKALTTAAIGYTLAPRINASGRMGNPALAVDLLLTEHPAQGERLAKKLCALNRERQEIELGIFEACQGLVESAPEEERSALVLASGDWHQGVVGIVASRLSEKYACPAFIICLQDGYGKGSCRSFGGMSLFAALEQCVDLLEGFGGHEQAAGFTILEEHIPAFRVRMNQMIASASGTGNPSSAVEVDAALESPALLTLEQVAALAVLEPHGTGNPAPCFSISGCTVDAVNAVGGGRHLKLKILFRNQISDAIFFSITAEACGICPGDRVDVVFYAQINEYRGRRTVQLQLLDLRPAQTRAQAERALYEKYRRGELLSAAEAAALTPSREEFAGLWRYLKSRPNNRYVEEPISHLAKNVARATGGREVFPRTMICLEVFHERGLVQLEQASGQLRIGLNAANDKVDLEESYILRRLREQIENH